MLTDLNTGSILVRNRIRQGLVFKKIHACIVGRAFPGVLSRRTAGIVGPTDLRSRGAISDVASRSSKEEVSGKKRVRKQG